MTREEIISNLLYMKRSVKEDTVEDITINEAIKALEQEPCEDAISRQAAIDAIEKLCEECNADYCGECRVKFDGLKNCKTILEQLPPVKPTELEQEFCENPHIYECSCGYGWDRKKVWRDHFCPNCGRKVQEGERSDKE